MYKIIAVLLTLSILFGYLYFSEPKDLVVTEDGNYDGLINNARALLQGDKFLKLQLKIANELYSKSLAPRLPSSSEMQELYHKLSEDEKILNEKMKALYSTEEQMANLLRMRADSLERASKWRVIDDAANQENMREVTKFKTIIPIIEGKLGMKKPPEKTTP